MQKITDFYGFCKELSAPPIRIVANRMVVSNLTPPPPCFGERLPPKTVQTFAGHSSLQVTRDGYGHLFRSDTHGRAMDAIAEAMNTDSRPDPPENFHRKWSVFTRRDGNSAEHCNEAATP